MPGSHRAAVTILCAHVCFGAYGFKSDTIQYIAVVSYGARNWPRYIHDVTILIKQIKSRHFFSHRQKFRDISSMHTAARCEPAITPITTLITTGQIPKTSLNVVNTTIKTTQPTTFIPRPYQNPCILND